MNQPITPPVTPVHLGTTPPPAVPPTPLASAPTQPVVPIGQMPPTPAAPLTQTPQAPPKQGGPHLLLAAALLVIVVAIIGGAYFFMSNQRTSETAVGKTTYKQPIAQPQNDFTSLESEANAIEVESNDGDFADVDKDIQSL